MEELKDWIQDLESTIQTYVNMALNPIWRDSDFEDNKETKDEYCRRLLDYAEKYRQELKEAQHEYYNFG